MKTNYKCPNCGHELKISEEYGRKFLFCSWGICDSYTMNSGAEIINGDVQSAFEALCDSIKTGGDKYNRVVGGFYS